MMKTNQSKVNFEKIKKAAIYSLKKPGKGKAALPKSESTQFPNLFVFRHTETFDNKRKIFSGRRDSRLTPQGILQAKELAQKLRSKKIDLIITAPLQRCRQTALEILKFHRRAKLIKEPQLLERDYGRLTGASKEKLMNDDFKKAILYRRSYDFPPPKGESIKDVQMKRIYPFCRELEKRMLKSKQNIAISCTNNTMRLIRMFFEGLTIEEMLTIENSFGDYASYVVK